MAWVTKGKNPNVAIEVLAATSSNEQKPDLTCTVCSITSTSQKAMQDHLEGKLPAVIFLPLGGMYLFLRVQLRRHSFSCTTLEKYASVP
jgi:hypothetical protein